MLGVDSTRALHRSTLALALSPALILALGSPANASLSLFSFFSVSFTAHIESLRSSHFLVGERRLFITSRASDSAVLIVTWRSLRQHILASCISFLLFLKRALSLNLFSISLV